MMIIPSFKGTKAQFYKALIMCLAIDVAAVLLINNF